MGIDNRRIQVILEDEGRRDVFEDLAIHIRGVRTGSWILNDATVTIWNVDKDTRERLTRRYRPENRLRGISDNRQLLETRGQVFIDIGRESTGLFRLFEGNIITITQTDPPDIALEMRIMTRYNFKSELNSKNFGPINNVRGVAESIANDLGLELDDSSLTEDRNISVRNLTFSGAMADQIKVFREFPFVDAYVDNNRLVVKNNRSPVRDPVTVINVRNGMIGIPRFNEYGINVKFLARQGVRVGSQIQIESDIYPATNGNYVIVNISFDVANRDTPFYFDVYATPVIT